ncbi:uncharacterized protein V1513DRAFT_386010, partial [Lipomyces chichibuensis]|uniref:uncharacterized protein n=1 Tax=Lipomyces chichibuensis TaxID=1546026 RepID=UPI0033435C09
VSPKTIASDPALVIMSLYCIFSHPAKNPASRAWLFVGPPPPKCLCQSPNLQRIGDAPVPWCL